MNTKKELYLIKKTHQALHDLLDTQSVKLFMTQNGHNALIEANLALEDTMKRLKILEDQKE